jgi:protein AroM
MLEWIGRPVEAIEVGVLDGMTTAEIDGLAPSGDEPRFVSRLRDGTEVVLRTKEVHERTHALLAQLDTQGLTAIVLLCTGDFPASITTTPLVTGQRAVDLGVTAVVGESASLGLMVPLEAQARAAELNARTDHNRTVLAAHATPYGPGRFRDATEELESSDAIVMHCMGYDERMLARVRQEFDGPVLLARRLVASALRQLL